MGIHNGIVLVRAGRQGWVHTGSLDGSESSSKVDRAVAIQISSTHAFDALAQVFWTDYALSGGPAPYYPAYLPLVLQEPTPTPQPDGAWLAYVNDQRGLADLSPVAENPTWSDGDWKHSRYMVKNDYLGHSEDLDNPWYTPEGLAAAQNGNAFVSSSTSSTDKYAIDFWMQSPFHAVAIVDPALQQVGFGSYREAIGRRHMGATLDVYRGLGTIPPTVTFPIEYPADGKTTALRSYMGGEWPDPLTSCPGYSAPAGLPVILQIGPGNLTPSVTAHSFEQGGAPLEHCEFDATNYINPDNYTQRVGRSVLSLRDAIVLIPRAPLTPGASYAVSVTSNGQTYVWTFGVATTARQIEPPVMALAR